MNRKVGEKGEKGKREGGKKRKGDEAAFAASIHFSLNFAILFLPGKKGGEEGGKEEEA